MDKKFWWIMAIAFVAGLVSALVAPSFAAADTQSGKSSQNPLAGMAPVEASKGLELPTSTNGDGTDVAHGRYLVGLLGCASCHTDGALIGKPDPSKTLAGSSIGIAYSNPMMNKYPGSVYPPNLTPDKKTGLGEWTQDEIVTLLRSGKTRHGRQTMAIMPWTSYAQLSSSDAQDIASYLLSLEPVKNQVPKQVLPGTPAKTPLVHVGLYRSR